MPGIRNFGIIPELGWDYDVKLFEDGPPILKIVMARDMGSSKVTIAYHTCARMWCATKHQRPVGEERAGVRWGSTSPIYSVNPADDQFRELASRASHFRL